MLIDEQAHQKEIDPRTASEVSRELHKTAQPLTVLNGMLEMALEKAHTIEDFRQCCERAIEELRRVNGCFDEVRKLLRSSQSSNAEANDQAVQ